MNALGSILQLLAVEELCSILKKIIKSMKHQLLIFCNARKLEELKENRCVVQSQRMMSTPKVPVKFGLMCKQSLPQLCRLPEERVGRQC